MKSGNTKKTTKEPFNTKENITNLYESREKLSSYLITMLNLNLDICTNQNMEQDLKY